MMKLTLLLTFALIVLGASAQKIKHTKGNMDFLKTQDELSLSFVYPDNINVGKLTEDEYIKTKMEKAEDKEKGAGEEWKENWYKDREDHYQPKFAQVFNDNIKDEKRDLFIDESITAEYGIIVTTTFIEPGYNVGVSRKNAYVNLTVTFVKNDNPENILAEFTILKSPGRTFMGSDYDTGMRIGEAYAKAGKEFALFLVKHKMVKK